MDGPTFSSSPSPPIQVDPATASIKMLKTYIINFLKSEAIKLALKKILGNAVAGGFKAWLIKLIITELFEEVAEPVIRLAIRKGQLVVDKTSGKMKVKRIERAKDEGDEDAYTRNIGSV